MIYPEIAELLIEMRNEDLAVRERLIQNGQLGKGYNPEMKKVHLRNTKQLEQIIQKIRLSHPSASGAGGERSCLVDRPAFDRATHFYEKLPSTFGS